MNRSDLQNGNVLFVVLAGIALFAALTVAVTRSSSTDGGAVMSQAEAKLHAATIMDFGNAVEQAVNRLTSIGGCDITEVSFERSPFDDSDTDYVNPNSPTDHSCHVFHPNGGQIEMIEIEEKWLNSSFSSRALYGNYHVSLACIGPVVSTSCNTPSISENEADLFLFLPHLEANLCEEINVALLGSDDIPVDSSSTYRHAVYYSGGFSENVAHLNFTSPHEGYDYHLKSACIRSVDPTPANSPTYYKILFER